jgi:uncharacterized protein YjbI with pentapeptide repeats
VPTALVRGGFAGSGQAAAGCVGPSKEISMVDRRHGWQAAPTTSTVSGEDLYGEDFTGQVVDHVLYLDVDMTESTSSVGAVFDECTFRSVRFNAAAFEGAAFTNCTFENCNFFGATFTDCKVVGSMFDRCQLDQLSVVGGDWSFVGLPGAVLKNAAFSDVRMREVDLVGVQGDGTTMRRCDLSGSSFAKASLEGADLRGSDLSGIEPGTVNLRNAIIDFNQAVLIATAYGLDVRAE